MSILMKCFIQIIPFLYVGKPTIGGTDDKTFTARSDIIHGMDLERLCGSLENISRTLQRKFPRPGKFPYRLRHSC